MLSYLLLLLSVSITTGHFDNTRDGQNNSEGVLTPANVGSIKKTVGQFIGRGSIIPSVVCARK